MDLNKEATRKKGGYHGTVLSLTESLLRISFNCILEITKPNTKTETLLVVHDMCYLLTAPDRPPTTITSRCYFTSSRGVFLCIYRQQDQNEGTRSNPLYVLNARFLL
jgi:hypothetical protein